MRKMTTAAALGALITIGGSRVDAQDTKVGFAVGAAVPVAGIALHEPTVSLSGWLAGPIRGPYGWRVEVGRVHLQMPDETMFRCAAAGFYCSASLYVTSVGGGLHFEPGVEKAIAPYGYVTIGLYHLTASAEAEDLHGGSAQPSYAWSDNAFGIALGSGVRVSVGDRLTLRAEFRYSGFNFKPGTVNWASLITPALNASVAF